MRWKLAAISFGAGVLAVTVGVASAASLGVLDARTLGTGSEVIAACDSTIGVSWDATGSPSYSGSGTPANSTFIVTKMALNSVDDSCEGASYQFVIADSAGAALVSQSGTLTLSAHAVTFTFSAINTKSIDQVTITIHE